MLLFKLHRLAKVTHVAMHVCFKKEVELRKRKPVSVFLDILEYSKGPREEHKLWESTLRASSPVVKISVCRDLR